MGIFKAYDIRGIYGTDLTEDIFYKIARAYARFLGSPKSIVVAHDCRKSSDSLFAAFAKGLNDVGVDVIDIGLASTPMSYFANGTLKPDGSVMITASHNTKEWNGCKLCKANAVPISGTSAGLKGTAGANRVRTVWYEITIRTAVPHWKERGKKCSSIFLLPAYLHLLPSVGRTQPKGRRQENLGFSLIDHKKDGE